VNRFKIKNYLLLLSQKKHAIFDFAQVSIPASLGMTIGSCCKGINHSRPGGAKPQSFSFDQCEWINITEDFSSR
jgi:hypothetical protein